MNVTTEQVLENLNLANNGYTFEQGIPKEHKAKLAELVERGLVIKKSTINPCRRGMTTNVYTVA